LARIVLSPPPRIAERHAGLLDFRQQPLAIGHVLAGEELPQVGRHAGGRGGDGLRIVLALPHAEEAIMRNGPLLARNIQPRLIRIESSHRALPARVPSAAAILIHPPSRRKRS